MKERILHLVTVYTATVAVFILAKVGFVAYHAGSGEVRSADVADILRHGLSLDLSTALYVILFPLILMVLSLWIDAWGQIRRILKVYFAVVATLLAIVAVSDTCLYTFWGFKLNSSVLAYLESPTGITSSVSGWYLAGGIGAVVVLSYLIYKLYVRCTPHSVPVLPMRGKCLGTLVALLLVAPLVIGIRGGVEVSTTNVGQVYYSDRQFLNHAAVNPLFNFLSSFAHSSEKYDRYDYFDPAECDRRIAEIFPTESIDPDTLLRVKRPNVVVILLEGCGGEFTEIGGRTDVTPNLNRLAHEGVYFTNCYGNSWRTDRGTVCALSGYPSFPQTSVMKMPDKSRTMPSIAATLKKNGYSTGFLYGGDIDFTNMKGYLIGTGFDRLVSMDDYTAEQRGGTKWGVRDDITFNTLYDLITTADSSERFLIGYLTLTSHEPWEVPIDRFDDKVLNAFHYLDRCVGDFIRRIRRTPQWDDLLIVMLPDHGIFYNGLDNSKPLKNHIPMIWTGGAVRQPREVTCVSNQTDLPATLLGQMGIDHSDFRFSRDVVSRNYNRPFAINTYNNGVMVIDSSGYIVYDFDIDAFIAREGDAPQRLLDLGKTVLQAASTDLKNRR